jgi:hypothetical protein
VDENTAVLRARHFLQAHGVTSAPVDVMALAQVTGFEVKFVELPEGEAGSTGMLRGKRYIWVNEKDPLMRQRFTILHEIAHDVLNLPSVHGQASEPSDSALTSLPGRPTEEKACDAFASECLVPFAVIKPLIEGKPFGVQIVAELARSFGASQHCVASQFIKASTDFVAFVLAEQGQIKLAFPSAALRAAGVRLLRGTSVPRGCAAETVMSAEDGAILTAESEGADWSHSDAAGRFSVYEEASFYAPKQQTYSFLTFETLGPALAVESVRSVEEDDDLLPELTGELTWKPRKR